MSNFEYIALRSGVYDVDKIADFFCNEVFCPNCPLRKFCDNCEENKNCVETVETWLDCEIEDIGALERWLSENV